MYMQFNGIGVKGRYIYSGVHCKGVVHNIILCIISYYYLLVITTYNLILFYIFSYQQIEII